MKVLVENLVPVEWKDNRLYFFGIEAIIFWKSPSLKSLLDPFMRELGQELYWLLIAFEATKGTYEDYHTMVEELGENFETGFNNWGEAVKNAGWGNIAISDIDFANKEAKVRVENPWELKIARPDELMFWCPFLCGKFSGIFSSAFKNTSRAKVTSYEDRGDMTIAWFSISQSSITIEEEVKLWLEKDSVRPGRKQDAMNVSLSHQNKRFRDVLDSTGFFIWETDKDFSLTFMTEKFAEILGQDYESIKQEKLTSLIEPQFLEEFYRKIEQLKKENISDDIVSTDLRLKEEFDHRWLNLRFKAVYDITENFYGLQGAGKDITKERELEERLDEQRQKATYSAKMAALGEMSGGIAHEINNPLAILSSQLDVMKMKEAKGSLEHDDFLKSFKTMKETINRISTIISGLKKFSRDDDFLKREEVTLRTLFDETLSLCSEKFKNEGITLYQSIEKEDLSLRCHPVQISQILINLLNNAYDALLGNSGEKWVRLAAKKEEGFVWISVTDSGEGVSPENLHRIMTPFFTTKDVGEGTGLGLSVSLGIAQAHNGDLFYDESSAYSRFVIKLPA